jgi:hypothetical protein
MPAVAPLAGWPLAALWGAPVAPVAVPTSPVQAEPARLGVWLAEIAAGRSAAGSGPAPVALLGLGLAPLAAPDRPADLATATPVVRVSDRGWIGEPSDSLAPNTPYWPRMAEPPALERSLPIYPDAARRLAATVGELVLANGDGRLDSLAGDWSVAGRRVVLRRGAHTRPLHAPLAGFAQVAELRAAGAAVGTSRLTLPLRPAAADLSLPACAIYAGSGGAEGAATLAGVSKPRLYGLRRNIEPILVEAGLLLYQLHDGPLQQVLAVRDRGVALTAAGDHASYAALAAASVAAGTYRTCLAAGVLRVGAAPSLITVDARGDADASIGGYGTGSPASIARKLLAGPGGLPGIDASRFDWPVGEAGLLVQGGTVAEAMEALAVSVFGWWGTDDLGAYQGGQLAAPEEVGPALTIEPWMLAEPPEEIGPPRAPWWRVRVAFQALGRTQEGDALAGAVTAADRAYFGQAWSLSVLANTGSSAAYPLAEDGPVLVSGFDQAGDATAIALRLLALFGRPRRLFQARLRPGAGGYAWPTTRLGACLSLRWPQHQALAAGRPMIVQGVSARGDATTLTLWG